MPNYIILEEKSGTVLTHLGWSKNLIRTWLIGGWPSPSGMVPLRGSRKPTTAKKQVQIISSNSGGYFKYSPNGAYRFIRVTDQINNRTGGVRNCGMSVEEFLRLVVD